MKSYAAIDRIEENIAVCEVELLETEQSKTTDFFDKETKMMDVLLEKIHEVTENVEEGDILVVEHDGENVIYIYYKDDSEKQRRIEILQAIMEQ